MDEGLKSFYSLIDDSTRLEASIKAFKNYDLSLKELTKIVPPPAIPLIITLLGDKTYKFLLQNFPKVDQSIFEEARKLAKQHFPRVPEHPAAQELMRNIAASQEKAKIDAEKIFSIRENKIKSIDYNRLWQQVDDKLIPIIRIGFRGIENESLLDSTLEWDSLTFLAQAFIELLREEFERAQKIVKPQKIINIDKKKIEENLKRMITDLHKIKKLGSVYGIELNPKKKEDENSDKKEDRKSVV